MVGGSCGYKLRVDMDIDSYCFTFRSRTNVEYIAGMERVGVPIGVAQLRL